MSVFAGPEISINGLVLSYDMSNTTKSWLGKPTTNLTPNGGITGMQSITHTYLGLEDGWQKYSISGTWNAGTYPYSFCSNVGVAFTGGVSYSTSCYIKSNCLQKYEYFGTNGTAYVNEPMNLGGTYFSVPQSDGSIFLGNYNFQYTNTTTQVFYFWSKPLTNGTVFNASTDFLWVKNIQVEQGTFCTPYTPSSRTTANCLLDLTNTNTLTTASLTYASDNTFSFNGSSDYIDCGNPTALQLSTAITIVAWINPVNTSGYGNIFSKNYNSGYRFRIGINNELWWYVSGNAAVSNYNLVPNNTWSQVVVSGDSSGLKAYVNGALVASNSTAYAPTAANTSSALIGTLGGAETFNGKIASIQVYNRALSAAEVQQNFNAFRGRFGI